MADGGHPARFKPDPRGMHGDGGARSTGDMLLRVPVNDAARGALLRWLEQVRF